MSLRRSEDDGTDLDLLHVQLTENSLNNFTYLSINDPGKRRKTHDKYQFAIIQNVVFEESEALLSATPAGARRGAAGVTKTAA